MFNCSYQLVFPLPQGLGSASNVQRGTLSDSQSVSSTPLHPPSYRLQSCTYCSFVHTAQSDGAFYTVPSAHSYRNSHLCASLHARHSPFCACKMLLCTSAPHREPACPSSSYYHFILLVFRLPSGMSSLINQRIHRNQQFLWYWWDYRSRESSMPLQPYHLSHFVSSHTIHNTHTDTPHLHPLRYVYFIAFTK